jgi:steroid delta-isomerase-like uncharacterized protein
VADGNGDPREVARQYHAAANAHDIPAMVALWEAGGTEVFPTYDRALRAPDELAAYYEIVFAAFPDVHWETLTITSEQQHVNVRSIMHATHVGTYEGLVGTGRRFALDTIDFFEISDGRITHNEVLFDGLASLRAVGAMPPLNSRRERALKATFNALTRTRKLVRRR